MNRELVLGLGRLDRLRFQAYFNIWHLLAFVPLALMMLFSPPDDSTLLTLSLASLIIFNLVGLKMIAQRYRDVGVSGYWSFFYLIPLASPFVYLLLATIPGDKEANRFGPATAQASNWMFIPALLPLALLIWQWVTIINLLFSSAPLLMASMSL